MNSFIKTPDAFAALHRRLLSLLLAPLLFGSAHGADNPVQAEVKNLSVNGELDEEKARLVIQANLKGLLDDKPKPLFATAVQHAIRASREKLNHSFALTIDIIQGVPIEIPLIVSGEGEVRQVTGEGVQDWAIRQETNATRFLVLRLKKTEKPITPFKVSVTGETEIKELPHSVTPLTLAPTQPALFNGYLRIDAEPELEVQSLAPAGLIPVELKFLPENMDAAAKPGEPEPLAFRFLGSGYSMALKVSIGDPEARQVVLNNFKLTGHLKDDQAAFTLRATARVKHPKGGSLNLLAGGVALTEVQEHTDGRLRYDRDHFVLSFDQAGEFPVQLKFNAGVRQTNGWKAMDFRVAPSALQPVIFQGLAADTQFEFAGAARPERMGNDFVSYLPANGGVKVAWKEIRPEAEGKLFYSAEEWAQISISPGLMRQVALLECKVMQGELNRLAIRLRGAGEVTRVQGGQILAWAVEPVPNEADRRLVVQFNQPQKDPFSLQVQVQTPLGAFPQSVEAMQLRPEGATRFAGYFRIVNEGAVRLEVLQASGLSQISPEQFPESEVTKALFRTEAGQRFAFRFSGAEFQLRIQADNVLPELSVSQVLAYHLGETELDIEAEIELDIREAPVRELLLSVPKGYSLARLTAAGLSDYFLKEEADPSEAQLRLVYGAPVSGRQVVQLRLERNQPLGQENWTLPKIEVTKAKSTRGHVGVSADTGFRLTPEKTEGLTEVATAFFPRQIAGIQAAFRLSEATWLATLRVERLPQSIQADAFHLYSIGEGIAYGSSVLNYLISGAPLAQFKLELSNEYYNVEFTGKDVRNWQKLAGGYQVQLHTPVSGAYTLLATYERPFKGQGDTLTFTGVRPLDAPSEQGHTIVISAYQFQVRPANVSAGLMSLEPGEVPPEYRLFFDAPILAAYRYTARPFNLELVLSPLAQGETLGQVVERAALTTRISKEGQVLTDARYFLKNRGVPNLRLTLPDGAQLWSVMVNGVSAVPVTDAQSNLIPLPQRADPNAVTLLDLKLAARSKNPKRVRVATPVVSAPVLLAEWKMEPDTGQRLVYQSGSISPVGGLVDVSGFTGLSRLFSGASGAPAAAQLIAALLLIVVAVIVWGWSSREGVYRFSVRHLSGSVLGLVACGLAIAAFVSLADLAEHENRVLPRSLTFLAPVQQSNSSLNVAVTNVSTEPSLLGAVGRAWPAIFALAIWIYSLTTSRQWFRPIGSILGWTLLFWSVLRWPNSAPFVFVVLLAFLLLKLVVPASRRLWRLPIKPKPTPPPTTATPAVALLLLVGSFWLPCPADAQLSQPAQEPPLADSVIQQIRVEDQFAFATAKIRWRATQDQMLPVLRAPAVLTRILYPTNSLKLIYLSADSPHRYLLRAQQDGAFDVELQYQLQVARKDGASGFTLPTQYGLVNRLTLTLPGLDVDMDAPQAVSIQPEETASTNRTVATLVLSPVHEPWIGWKPRSRDTRREKAVFYAEIFQLYVPAAGVIEGQHLAQIRPAQGQLAELSFDVPPGSTITDVLDPAAAAAPVDSKSQKPPSRPASLVSLWRFDPDTRKLRVSLSPSLAKPFSILIKSQVATGPLPYHQSAGLICVNHAASQIGLLGVATGSEVQLDGVTAEAFSPINLEDFPAALAPMFGNQFPGLTLRRAYRYSDSKGSFLLTTSPVEPDVRVENQITLSLGEDRTVFAATVQAEITRAGIFRLSFVLPAGLDVESISGPVLSHWTELKTPEGRIITLHLRGKTQGQQQFSINLAGPGVKAVKGWAVPRLVLREANKQRGQLLIVPEQGMRLQVLTRDGVTQLDPQKSGIRQKGVLAFRLLQGQWNLGLDIEQVDAWIQVTSLQHVTVNEAQVKVIANLQYQIENTGLKTLRVLIPTNAESARFRGEQVADFLPVEGQVNHGLQTWEVKLHRRILGAYLLQITYQVLTPEKTAVSLVQGVQALAVNSQRGFLTVQSGGRLQVRVDTLPAALQPTEWQSIPRALRLDLQAAPANYTFRLVEPGYQLPLKLERHEAARLLPARVNSITLTSVISDDGVMLTQVRLEMIPGDKRLLHLTLPARSRFWFAFVNQNGVWPWQDKDQILLPLEPHSKTGQAVPVELFYAAQLGATQSRALDLELLGPKFDLPLENITWQIFLNEKWKLKHWTGSLQFQSDQILLRPAAIDLDQYLRNESTRQREKTKEAEQLLELGNTWLQRGDPQQARRAFQTAYGLSQGDDAFNEDARVQLHNLKMQQALVGLNVRQAAVAGESGAGAGKGLALRDRKAGTYTQAEAKAVLDRNSAEENAAFMRLAERLIQQQDAAVASPSAIRATIPEQGRRLTFKRLMQVNTWADLNIGLKAASVPTASSGVKFLLLAAIFVLLALITWIARSRAALARGHRTC